MSLLEKTEYIIEFGGTYQGNPSNIKDAIEIRDLWIDAATQAIQDNPHKSPIEAITDMRRKG